MKKPSHSIQASLQRYVVCDNLQIDFVPAPPLLPPDDDLPVTIRVTDDGGLFDTQSFVVNVTDKVPAEIHGTKSIWFPVSGAELLENGANFVGKL